MRGSAYDQLGKQEKACSDFSMDTLLFLRKEVRPVVRLKYRPPNP